MNETTVLQLLNWENLCSLTTTVTTLIVYRLLTVKLREQKPIYKTIKAVQLQGWSGPENSRKLRFPDFMTTEQVGGKFVSLMHKTKLPPANAPGIYFCSRLSRPQGHSAIRRILRQRKIPMISPGTKPATFRFVIQHLKHCATADPCTEHSH